MRIEHFALNVADPVAMADWYCENLDMQIARSGPPPHNARFIADSTGHVILEIYCNPPELVPDYATMDPLILHIAFMTEDVAAAREKLLAAGATEIECFTSDEGDQFAMLRDPWGLALQLVQRAKPML